MYSIGAFNLGPLELGIILLVVLIIFGPKQLPKLGKMFGKTMTEVREGIDEANKTINEPAESTNDTAANAAAPKFDPQTGKPLTPETDSAPKFDPQTGELLNADEKKD